MSSARGGRRGRDPDTLQERVHALGRAALEGNRSLSDLLGEALAELRGALRLVRELEAEVGRGSAGEPDPVPPEGGREERRSASAPAEFVLAEAPPRPRVELFDSPVPEEHERLEESLRDRVAGALYLGTLAGGDRLPSIREISRRTGLNHKIVRRVYRSLEHGGFVEVRDRSGIYVAEVEPRGTDGMGPLEAWVAAVVADALRQGLGAGELPGLLTRLLAARRLRCACVDSTEDDRFALCQEVERRFGLEAVPVAVGSGGSLPRLPEADLVVTTPFHAPEVRSTLDPGKPLVVACLHPAWRQAVEAHPEPEPLSLFCVDRTAGDRLRQGLGAELARRVRVVPIGPRGAPAERPGAPALATPAAGARLSGGPAAGPTVPPYLSPRASRQLAHVVVGLNRAPSARAAR